MTPSLTEPGIRTLYFQSLAQSSELKAAANNFVLNTGLAVFLAVVVVTILWCMRKSKPDPLKKHQQIENERLYILNKVKAVNIAKQKDRNFLITGLPEFA